MCVIGPALTRVPCILLYTMDTEDMKKQTLMWVENYPRDKLKISNMVMIIDKKGKPRFVPKHLL